MRSKLLILAAAVLGGVAGTIWSTVPQASAGEPARPALSPEQIERSVTYSGCNEVRALGKAPLHAGQPGYREEMDGDLDGIACEPHRSDY